jgi:hypothetical protein
MCAFPPPAPLVSLRQGNYRESMYGAYLFSADSLATESPLAPSPADVVEYTVLHNTTSVHALPTFINVMNSAIYKTVADARGGPSGSITVRNWGLPYTLREDIFLGAVSTLLVVIVSRGAEKRARSSPAPSHLLGACAHA